MKTAKQLKILIKEDFKDDKLQVGKLYNVYEENLCMYNPTRIYQYNEENRNKYPDATRNILISDPETDELFDLNIYDDESIELIENKRSQ